MLNYNIQKLITQSIRALETRITLKKLFKYKSKKFKNTLVNFISNSTNN